MHIDDTGRYPHAAYIDNHRITGIKIPPDGNNFTVLHHDVRILELFSAPGQNGSSAQQRGFRCHRLIAAGVRCSRIIISTTIASD